MSKITESAKGEGCTIRIPDPDTTARQIAKAGAVDMVVTK
jgi:hypothetical protein